MPKEKTAPSANETKLLGVRQKLETAKKNDAAKSTDATKKLVADLEAEAKATASLVNRERFVRVAGGRVKKARAAIRNLANVAAPRTYTYTENDVAAAEKAINEETAKSINALRSALTKGGTAKSSDDFTFA